MNELDEKWYSFGVELNVEDEELDNLEKHSDPHKRLIKMFSMWLEKGENPTYMQTATRSTSECRQERCGRVNTH